jgi:hypothetical protein
MSDGGKGSAPRKQQDHEAYSKNWDAIFGKKDSLAKMIADENERMKLYERKPGNEQNNV